ncbi:MAG: DNA-directed RNA polymerase subunit F [Candidatus Altiarchaeum hamiconexum]|uniref:DNA-directed RNA polymerase subunit Rpo4 n=1 Tax=Candidatus Altarchaeum hamiconexum TaxID=1803513 RepID=A0A8J7YWU2_9ARCH|nr:DNA-directed RNA polymerase subunit F [Candidatus Altarchaeum hamiconexum]OIQ06144.1 MAG: hypothetical protein AUK59_00955 [Candidatus Altarchaeum sp. CG2_30_32_3053]PIN66843.1 MAG: DNA-directed RNA polymerase subunit F [Candidatus Altarchaeum sp. CG12_big_fil_rev_8_21_14_0_65_33_22]PIV28900.1 MAG: DNA-directed RNA polymerase subunit F [Candidatus Altarchaeum sp. CG03_land_8_20_14_0_80_32_618]PJC14977.1 MAG: DNA-directed RNA polymerase subunit F [Candidatus Altarchaeum sp. CG_4_9_14_0_8_um_f
MKITEKKLTTLSHVREILLKREKIAIDGEPMTDDQKKLLNYANKFSKLSVRDTKELQKKLKGIKLHLSDVQIVKIIDMLPKNIDEIRAIFSKDEKFSYNADELKQILDCVAQYI